MNTTRPGTDRRRPRRAALTLLAIGGCFATDAFVLRTLWDGREVAEGQFRRGYFERFDDGVGIAADGAIRTGMIPTFVLDGHGNLEMPPGLVAVAPIGPGVRYEATSGAPWAPYLVIGLEAPLGAERADLPAAIDEGRLVAAQTLTLHDGRLALEPWDATAPWRVDATRLSALHDACVTAEHVAPLAVTRRDDGLDIRLGRCSLLAPLPTAQTPLLAALAGPEWLSVARQPAWGDISSLAWPVIGAIAVKIALYWWGLGLASTIAASAALGVGAIVLPMAALLMWPVMAIVGAVGAAIRAAAWAWRRLPPRARLPMTLAVLLLAGGAVASSRDSGEAVPIAHGEHGSSLACAVVGYSTVKGEGLRQMRGGIFSLLNERCPRCEYKTAGMFAGGETLAWIRDSYCRSPPSFGADGPVFFLGGVNDDYFWGYFSLPRLAVAGQQGGESWRGNEIPAAAASLARIGAQEAALHAFMDCVHQRRSRLLFLHDSLVTDLVAGRTPERAAMLEHRRAAVEAAGGTFVDLSQEFAPEAGVTWFNDYVHLSRIAHERVADLACRLMADAAPPPRTIAEPAPR